MTVTHHDRAASESTRLGGATRTGEAGRTGGDTGPKPGLNQLFAEMQALFGLLPVAALQPCRSKSDDEVESGFDNLPV